MSVRNTPRFSGISRALAAWRSEQYRDLRYALRLELSAPLDRVRGALKMQWRFAGEPVGAGILADIDRVVADSALLGLLSEHLTAVEVQRFVDRGRRLCAAGLLPEMAGGWPPIPWPPF